MVFNVPKKILIKSDSNEMEYTHTIKKSINNKEELYVYTFVKSETKLGKETYFTEAVLRKLLSNTFKIIE